MPFTAHILKVLIASPGDTMEERDAVERALHGWNADRAERESVVLLPRRWESNAVPRLGGRAQSVINEQLVDEADIVLALFDSRLGMATGVAVSGTAEEIERANTAGKPVHVWFSDETIPRDADLSQVAALREFKGKLSALGLLGVYASPDDLAYKARQAIEHDLEKLNLGTPRGPSPGTPKADLRAKYASEREPVADSRGKITMRTRRQRILIENVGERAAERVRIELESLDGELPPPSLHNSAEPTIAPGADFAWPASLSFGTATVFRVIITWAEGEQERSRTQDISIYT